MVSLCNNLCAKLVQKKVEYATRATFIFAVGAWWCWCSSTDSLLVVVTAQKRMLLFFRLWWSHTAPFCPKLFLVRIWTKGKTFSSGSINTNMGSFLSKNQSVLGKTDQSLRTPFFGANARRKISQDWEGHAYKMQRNRKNIPKIHYQEIQIIMQNDDNTKQIPQLMYRDGTMETPHSATIHFAGVSGAPSPRRPPCWGIQWRVPSVTYETIQHASDFEFGSHTHTHNSFNWPNKKKKRFRIRGWIQKCQKLVSIWFVLICTVIQPCSWQIKFLSVVIRNWKNTCIDWGNHAKIVQTQRRQIERIITSETSKPGEVHCQKSKWRWCMRPCSPTAPARRGQQLTQMLIHGVHVHVLHSTNPGKLKQPGAPNHRHPDASNPLPTRANPRFKQP